MTILVIWIVLLLVGGYGFLYCLGASFGGRTAGLQLCAGATLYVGGWIGVGTLLYYTVKEIAKHIV